MRPRCRHSSPGLSACRRRQRARGAAWNWSGEPFGAGLFGKFSGQVALKLKQAKLLPQLTASDINATLRLGKDDIVFADAAGHLAGGPLSGEICSTAATTV